MAALPGASSRTLGRYELIQELAKSQLGALWVAFVPGSDKLVAIRRVNTAAPVTAEDKDALSEGGWWTLELSHPRIAHGVDVVMSEGELGIVTEYHEGEVLRSLLRLASFKRKPIPLRAALRIASDVLEALDEAENQAQPLSGGKSSYACGGLVPDSVLVASDGQSRLLDVGVAGACSRVSNVARNPEMVSYFAPEQIEDKQVDIRSNLYAVGVMLWEMLAGKRLYVGSTYTAVTDRIQSGDPPRLDASKPVGGDPIPSAIADVVARALHANPSERYASPKDLIEALSSAHEPASHEEVASLVDDLAGNTLATRRKVVERAVNPAAAAARPMIGARAPARSAPDLGKASPAASPKPPVVTTKPGLAPPTRERKATLMGIAPVIPPPPRGKIDSIDSEELESISKVEAMPVEPTEGALVSALTTDSTESPKPGPSADAPGTHLKTQVLGTPAVLPAGAKLDGDETLEELEDAPISLELVSEAEPNLPKRTDPPKPPSRERAEAKSADANDGERSSDDSAVAWLGPPPGVALDDDADVAPSRASPEKKSKLAMIVGGVVAGAAVVLILALATGKKTDESPEPTPAAKTPEPEPTTAKVEEPKPAPDPEPPPEPKEEPKEEEEAAKDETEPAKDEAAEAEAEEPKPAPKPVARPTWRPRPKPKPKTTFTPSGI